MVMVWGPFQAALGVTASAQSGSIWSVSRAGAWTATRAPWPWSVSVVRVHRQTPGPAGWWLMRPPRAMNHFSRSARLLVKTWAAPWDSVMRPWGRPLYSAVTSALTAGPRGRVGFMRGLPWWSLLPPGRGPVVIRGRAGSSVGSVG